MKEAHVPGRAASDAMRVREEAALVLRERFEARFGNASCEARAFEPFVLASAPGRVELAGNHTDHQGGRTIAAAIEKRAWALARPNGTDEIRVSMEGFGEARFSTTDLEARERERGTSRALVRGMAAAFVRSGCALSGFDMVTRSAVPVGSGVSSSAAFEVLLGTAIRALFDPAAETEPPDLTAIALEGVWAERTYFGKPCGAQDQLSSAYGGIVALDFSDAVAHVEPIAFDADACAYSICLIDSRCDHSAYTDEYAAVPADMFDVARYFDCERLEDVPYDLFLSRLPEIRAQLKDRKVLRALHYFEETRRASEQVQALKKGDFEAFLAYARLSGASSAQFLQNVSPHADGSQTRQPAMVILALCAHLLGTRGAWRIHGGGFGGSVLAFVPREEAASFAASMDRLLGYEACSLVSISPRGAWAERLA
ncbi:galactokinase [Raoultibacter phocaeensis]|uniref:galactokinase n=1 Tax=Raoultibacter phocaeensis TaxID=2479841 RepID=UPI001118EF19|nr:galactokinase family protein [Raoultibacter phocaeensis]